MEQLSRGDSDKNAITLKGLLCGYETFGNSFCIPSSQSWAVAPTKCFLRIKVNSFPNLIHYSVTEEGIDHTQFYFYVFYFHTYDSLIAVFLLLFICHIIKTFLKLLDPTYPMPMPNMEMGKMKVDVNEN